MGSQTEGQTGHGKETDFPWINHVYDVSHILFFSDCLAAHACDDILCINPKQLGDWSGSRGMRTKQGGLVFEEYRIVGESIAFRAEVVHEESMK